MPKYSYPHFLSFQTKRKRPQVYLALRNFVDDGTPFERFTDKYLFFVDTGADITRFNRKLSHYLFLYGKL